MPKLHGSIAAGHAKTVEAGLEMLQLGGNAFDAAVAGVLASFVVEPTLTSPAGGGFLLAHPATGQNLLFDFFTQTPQRQRDLSQVDFRPAVVDFGGVTQEFQIGLGSVAVPGTIGGLLQVHQRLGKLPLQAVAAPAIQYARTGVEFTAFQAYCFGILAPILLDNPGTRQVFAPDGALPVAGSLWRMPDLAESLAYLVEAGAAGFYQGDLARQLVQDCQTQGGHLTMADLRDYRVIERQPLSLRYRDRTVLTNPPPSAGGALIAFALKLLEPIDFSRVQFGRREHLQLLARVMQLTNMARKDSFDTQLYTADVAERFLDLQHLAAYQGLINSRQISGSNKWGSTTHLSVIDSEGNAASVTTSNGEGSAYVIPGTGIMTNNMLGEADLHPHGFHNWQTNLRISSMMAPTLILDHGQPEVALGSGGANRIRTAILQVISNLLDFGMTVEQAVNSPRVHWEDGVFNVEPGFEQLTIDPTQFPFDETLELWPQPNMFFGGVHTASHSLSQAAPQPSISQQATPLNPQFMAAGDQRRDGKARIG